MEKKRTGFLGRRGGSGAHETGQHLQVAPELFGHHRLERRHAHSTEYADRRKELLAPEDVRPVVGQRREVKVSFTRNPAEMFDRQVTTRVPGDHANAVTGRYST